MQYLFALIYSWLKKLAVPTYPFLLMFACTTLVFAIHYKSKLEITEQHEYEYIKSQAIKDSLMQDALKQLAVNQASYIKAIESNEIKTSKEIDTLVNTNPIYHNVCLDDAGLSIINKTIAENAVTPYGVSTGMSSSGTAKWGDK